MAEVLVNRGHIYEEAAPAKNYQLTEGESVHIACDIAPHKIPLRTDVYVSIVMLSYVPLLKLFKISLNCKTYVICKIILSFPTSLYITPC